MTKSSLSEATQHRSSGFVEIIEIIEILLLSETNLHFLHQHHPNSVTLRIRDHLVDFHISKVLVMNSIMANWAASPVFVSQTQIMQNAHEAVHMTTPGDSRCNGLTQADGAVLFLRIRDNLHIVTKKREKE